MSSQEFYNTDVKPEIGHAEKAVIKEFIKKRWHEVIMLESDKRHDMLLQSQNQKNSARISETNERKSPHKLLSPKTNHTKQSMSNSNISIKEATSKSVYEELDFQIKQRREGAAKIDENIHKQEEKKRRVQALNDAESTKIDRTLKQITQKSISIYPR